MPAHDLHDPAFVLSLLVAVGVLAQWVSARLRVPAILLLLLIGFLAGPVTGYFDPDAMFGDLLFPGVSVAVALILFEGALTLNFADLRGAERVVLRLVTLGVAVTVAIMAWTTHRFLDFPWGLALLFGAIVSVTGPTVVVPLLRAVRPTEKVARILRWEGILIDPLGAVLAVIIFEAILAEATLAPGGNALLGLLETLGIGALLGIAAGFTMGFILKRHLLPDFLANVGTLGMVLLVHALSNLAAAEAGLVAVTAMGMTMSNMKGVPTDRILDFKESLSVLLISVLFIVLAARIEIGALLALGPAILAVLAIVLFVARPLAAVLCTLGTATNWRERTLLAWIAPRGIIAAAISALFSLRLQAAGIEHAGLLVGVTFAVIIVTVVLQSLTARPLAKLLGIAQPEEHGVLVVGANPVTLEIAEALKDKGCRVLVADSSWAQVRAARMRDLSAFYGNPVSEYADRKLDLVGLGVLLAMSRRPAMNELACVRYRPEFGSGNVYTIRRDPHSLDRESEPAAFGFRGHFLFAPEMTLERLESDLRNGKAIKVTQLTADFTFDDLLTITGGADALLFAISPEGAVRPFSDETTVRASDDWHIVYLAAAEESAENKTGSAAETPGSAASDSSEARPKGALPG